MSKKIPFQTRIQNILKQFISENNSQSSSNNPTGSSSSSPTLDDSKASTLNEPTNGKLETGETPSNWSKSSKLAYLKLQGQDSIRKKLNRPFGIGEQVVLLKDYPENNVYRGYVCSIIDVYYKGKDENSNQIPDSCELEFFSVFPDEDKPKGLERLEKNCEYPTTCQAIIMSSKDFARVEEQDLQYKTFFP